MSLFTEEDKIFEAWEKVLENSHLVTDGIVVKKHKGLLRSQVDLYWSQTDIIVCCGVEVGSLFRSLIKDISLQKYVFETADKEMAKKILYYQTGDGKLIIDFYHPQAHISKGFMYNSIRDIVSLFYKS